MGHWKIGVKILAKAGRVKILWKLKYGGQNSIFFSWNPWSKFYVPWKGGSKFYIFSQCLEKGGSKPRSLPTNFTEGVPPPGLKCHSNFPGANELNQLHTWKSGVLGCLNNRHCLALYSWQHISFGALTHWPLMWHYLSQCWPRSIDVAGSIRGHSVWNCSQLNAREPH